MCDCVSECVCLHSFKLRLCVIEAESLFGCQLEELLCARLRCAVTFSALSLSAEEDYLRNRSTSRTELCVSRVFPDEEPETDREGETAREIARVMHHPRQAKASLNVLFMSRGLVRCCTKMSRTECIKLLPCIPKGRQQTP